MSISGCDRRPRPSARCEPIEPRRRPTCTRRRSRLCASAWSWRPDARPSIDTSASSASSATSPTVLIPLHRELLGRHRADAPEPLDRQRVEEGELAVGRHDEEAIRLRDPARHLREELRPGDADGDGKPDPLADVPAQPHRDLRGGARQPLEAADVEERLVDREALDERRCVLEDRGTSPCSPRRRRTCGAGRRRRGGRDAGPARRPSRCGSRAPSPRSWQRGRPRPRRSRAAPEGAGRPAAPRTHRRRRRPRGGSSRHSCEHMFAYGGQACNDSTRHLV